MSQHHTATNQHHVTRSGPGPLLQVQDLQVDYRRPGGRTRAVRGVSFNIEQGRTVALVGESGSGKTSIGRAVLGLHPRSVQVRGRILFGGTDLLGLGPAGFRDLRGRRIALIPQDPLAGLNPVHTIGKQVAEAALAHGRTDRRRARSMAIDALQQAGLDDAEERYGAYPHQLSGGQRQRVLIATALIGAPDLVVADEPTSALDVTVQRRILDHMEELVRDTGAALLLITHDLGVAADRSDEVVVLRDGQLIEQLPAQSFLEHATEPYSQSLALAAPRMDSPVLVQESGAAPQTAHHLPPADGPGATPGAGPLLRARALTKTFPRPGHPDLIAVDGVDLTLYAGQSLGVVGESGSGKTTLARMVLGLSGPDTGTMSIGGRSHGESGRRAGRRELRRLVQPVFQDPYSSLDPAHSIAASIAEPLRALTRWSRSQRRARVLELLEQVRLPAALARRRPHELSGGQLQRVAIARALVISPGLLVLDEPVSSLDVSVQEQILHLLADLRAQTALAYLFISHDLAVVRQVCTDVVVMRRGAVVERGRTEAVFADPQHEYTKELIAAIPGARHARLPQPATVSA